MIHYLIAVLIGLTIAGILDWFLPTAFELEIR